MRDSEALAAIREIIKQHSSDQIEKASRLAALRIWVAIRELPEFTDYTKMEIDRMREIEKMIFTTIADIFIQE